MRHLLILLFALAALPACAPSTRDPGVLPPPTLTSAPAETPLPAPTSTPVPLAQILADFPLALAVHLDLFGADLLCRPCRSLEGAHLGGRADRQSDRPEIHSGGGDRVLRAGGPYSKPPEQVWRQPGTFEYTVAGDGVYVGDRKVYQWPLEDNLMWRSFRLRV